MTEIKGIIFDCDGTVADTMPLHWRAWSVVTKRYGLHFPEDRFYAYGGVPSRDIFKILSAEQGIPLDPIEASREKEEAFMPLLPTVTAIEPVVQIARDHHGKIPLAIATGGIYRIIHQVLEHLKIRHLFDHVVTSEHVQRQKPAPDIFLEAARRIGVEPQYCLAYEDTDLGMQAIRSAGMRAVDVRELLAGR